MNTSFVTSHIGMITTTLPEFEVAISGKRNSKCDNEILIDLNRNQSSEITESFLVQAGTMQMFSSTINYEASQISSYNTPVVTGLPLNRSKLQ